MYEIPDEVRFADRDTRIRWWRSKTSREMPVFVFFDLIDTGMVPVELQAVLAGVRDKRRRVEESLRLVQSPEFQRLEGAWLEAVAQDDAGGRIEALEAEVSELCLRLGVCPEDHLTRLCGRPMDVCGNRDWGGGSVGSVDNFGSEVGVDSGP